MLLVVNTTRNKAYSYLILILFLSYSYLILILNLQLGSARLGSARASGPLHTACTGDEQPHASHNAGRQAGPLNQPAAMPSPVFSVNMYGASPLMTPNVVEMVNEGKKVMPMPHEDNFAQTQPSQYVPPPLPLCNLHHHKIYRYPDQQSVRINMAQRGHSRVATCCNINQVLWASDSSELRQARQLMPRQWNMLQSIGPRVALVAVNRKSQGQSSFRCHHLVVGPHPISQRPTWLTLIARCQKPYLRPLTRPLAANRHTKVPTVQ